MIRLHVIVKGQVQGVGFRYHVQKHAKDYKLTGQVRNLYSGDVDLEIQGDPQIIDVFLNSLDDIPFARIEGLETSEMELQANEHSFTIKY